MTSRAAPEEGSGRYRSNGTISRKLLTLAEKLQRSRDPGHIGIFQQLLDGIPEQAGLIDAEDWTIVAANDAWLRHSIVNNYSSFRVGDDYYREVARIADEGDAVAQSVRAALDEIRD